MRDRKGADPGTSLPRPARHATTTSERYVAIIGDVSMRINDEAILSVAYDEDLEAELAEERYRRALKRLTVSDVLATVDDMIQSEPDERHHPLFALARHCLRSGGFRSTGQRSHMAEFIADKYETLIDMAIERLVQEELASGVSWED